MEKSVQLLQYAQIIPDQIDESAEFQKKYFIYYLKHGIIVIVNLIR